MAEQLEPSINEMLQTLGYTTAPSHWRRCKIISRNGKEVGHFDAFEAAQFVTPEWDVLSRKATLTPA